ncbi:MAG TPA: DUF1559 domain-containing protein [Tepidisphaeraceae bacterium]|nr:DUF1559 domain-containing protein [Tepidisphaeraceae bacterium]
MAVRPPRASVQPLSHRGSTLVELLVVVGIIALLLAFLLPVLSGVQGAARRTVCASRLRDLSLACLQYSQDYKRFPEAHSRAIPHQLEVRLLNQLSPYLRYPAIEASTSANRLPVNVQCPFVEEIEVDRGPSVAPAEVGGAEFYTGYMYLAGLERLAVNKSAGDAALESGTTSLAVLLKPERTARAKGSRRAVIWADDLHLTLAPQISWYHSHPFASSIAQTMGFAGQHRAFTDGSLEWQPKEKLEISFEPDKENEDRPRRRKKLREVASYVVKDTFYWW